MKNRIQRFFHKFGVLTSKSTEQSENSNNFKVRFFVGILGNQFPILSTTGVISLRFFTFNMMKNNPCGFFFYCFFYWSAYQRKNWLKNYIKVHWQNFFRSMFPLIRPSIEKLLNLFLISRLLISNSLLFLTIRSRINSFFFLKQMDS